MTAKRPAILEQSKQGEVVADTAGTRLRAGPQDGWTAFVLFLLISAGKPYLALAPLCSPHSLHLPPAVHTPLL